MFGCGKEGHSIADCPNIKVRRRDNTKFEKGKFKNKQVGEAHISQEWDSNEESSDSDSDNEIGVATMAFKEPTTKPPLFDDLTDDEDDFTHTCLLERGPKVDPNNPFLDNDDEVNSEDEKMIKKLGRKGAKQIMKLMIEIEDRCETIEVQKELFRLE